GKGSIGGVEIEVDGVRTEPRYLTEWRIISDWYSRQGASPTNYDTIYIHLDLRFRFDLHSICRGNLYTSTYIYIGHQAARSTCFQRVMRVSNGVPDTFEVYQSKFLDAGLLLYDPGRIRVVADPYYSTIGHFDPLFHPSMIQKYTFDTGWYSDRGFLQTWSALEQKFAPPDKALILLYPPRPYQPYNGEQFVPPTNAVLRWNDTQFSDSIKHFDRFRIQVSRDSLFTTTTVDSVVTELECTIPLLTADTKYFWRVAGLNSEGQSRWSRFNIKFTTAPLSSVHQVKDSSSRLRIFPNPTFHEIRYILSDKHHGKPAEIVVLDLLGNQIKTVVIETNEGTIDVSGLTSGVYIVRYRSQEEDLHEILHVVK
ncbi:MAG TPA: T9SS type A sorting domain-containing protein, partial [Candidatus Kapabacteria bacterium]